MKIYSNNQNSELLVQFESDIVSDCPSSSSSSSPSAWCYSTCEVCWFDFHLAVPLTEAGNVLFWRHVLEQVWPSIKYARKSRCVHYPLPSGTQVGRRQEERSSSNVQASECLPYLDRPTITSATMIISASLTKR